MPKSAPDAEAALVADLCRAENLPGAEANAEFTSTHGSLVFLTAHDVFKVKRAKNYGFFDYSTAEQRRFFCEEEVRLNRRGAAEVYLGVLPVSRDDRGYSLTRPGATVDWAVHMRRLPEAASALAQLRTGTLTAERLVGIARACADYYRRCTPHVPDLAALRVNFEENFAQLAPMVPRYFAADRLAALAAAQRRWLDSHAHALAARGRRDGHGDLRLEHIYVLHGRVLLIDCIEFLDRFRIADPALDAAFLAMDLRWRGRAELAQCFLGAFAAAYGDAGAAPLWDGYISYRATVRAKVACFVADDPASPETLVRRKTEEAAQLFALAADCLG